MKLELETKHEQSLAQTLFQCFAIVISLALIGLVACFILIHTTKTVIQNNRPIPTSLLYHGKATN